MINTIIVITERDDGMLTLEVETLGGQGTVKSLWKSESQCEVADALKLLPDIWLRLKQRTSSTQDF